WFNTPVNTGNFTTSFTYQVNRGGVADGGGFVLQTAGTSALGGGGGSKGYDGIPGASFGLMFNLYTGGPGVIAIAVVTNGTGAAANNPAYTQIAPVEQLNSNSPWNVTLTYVGGLLQVKI